MTDYEELQVTLEDDMVSRGAARYDVELERGLCGTGPGKALMRKAIQPMAESLAEVFQVRADRVNKGIRYIRHLHPNILADITMRRLLDCAAKEESLTKTCKAIAVAVEWHVKDAALNTASKAIWNKTQERLKKTQNPTFRRASIDGTVAGMRKWAEENAKDDLLAKLADVHGCGWGIDEQVEVGGALIDHFCRSTKMVRTVEVRQARNRSKAIVRFTEGTKEWLVAQHEYAAIARPVHLPMVVPPTPWASMTTGGYRDNAKAGVKFMKTKSRAQDLESLDLQDIYDSVNLIQATPWRVNRHVYGVMRQIWDAGSEIGGVPPKFAEDGMKSLRPIPAKFEKMEREEARMHPEYKAWLVGRRQVHEYNTDLVSECQSFSSLMSVVEQFAGYPAFYHPHKLDWRQRTYPISMYLNPQGDQFNKGLIEFSNGKRMGDSENSGAWLAIQGANAYGIDKCSFEERIAWVAEHYDMIYECALDPLGTPFWTTADKPFPFLAFCFEWAAYARAGDEHVTHLPVALDGANSGLQHLSCMLRDPDGARITCVSPGEQPEDVYQYIADQVENDLFNIIASCEVEPWAEIWKGKVCRKITKQPTMTYTYSATESGMRDQIVNALNGLDRLERDKGFPGYLSFTDPSQNNVGAAEYLARIVRAAIAARMVKAAEAMEFLRQCAQVYSKTGLPLRWKTPLGVPIVQYYPTTTSKRKRVFINGQEHKLNLNIDAPNRLDKRKATAGVSPNYVHSMDSTHLLWTVMYVSDSFGITDFAMIHDSFGTHATGVDAMAYSLREMMVTLYSVDRLAEFRQAIVEALHGNSELIDELPAVPSYGSFDIETVRDSDYFFA